MTVRRIRLNGGLTVMRLIHGKISQVVLEHCEAFQAAALCVSMGTCVFFFWGEWHSSYLGVFMTTWCKETCEGHCDITRLLRLDSPLSPTCQPTAGSAVHNQHPALSSHMAKRCAA